MSGWMVSSFSVQGSPLQARADTLTGAVLLRWGRYQGPHFERYVLRRRRIGEERTEVLTSPTDPSDTTYVDAAALPETYYAYSLLTYAAGQKGASEEREVIYRLPSVDLARADFDYLTATAHLAWSRYAGPRFEAYEVHRQAEGLAEQVVKELTHVDSTRYTDTPLDGNTTYTYWISVRTGWLGIKVSSNERGGRFYALDDVWRIPFRPATSAWAVGLALDEQDHLYIAILGGPRPRWVIIKALSEKGEEIARQLWASSVLDSNSPIHLRVGRGRIYTAVGTLKGETLVSASQQAETFPRVRPVNTEGASPAGLYLEESGDLLLVDNQAVVYRLSEDGEEKERSDLLRGMLVNQAIPMPLSQVIVRPGAGMSEGDLFILLVPGRTDHSVFGRTRTSHGSFIGGHTFDDGVGLGDGETIAPVAVAFDEVHERLLVLEQHGRLQVLDGRLNMPFDLQTRRYISRYITKWGSYGDGDGEFLASSPASVAMVVDSEGKVYVADVVGEEVRIQIFRP